MSPGGAEEIDPPGSPYIGSAGDKGCPTATGKTLYMKRPLRPAQGMGNPLSGRGLVGVWLLHVALSPGFGNSLYLR